MRIDCGSAERRIVEKDLDGIRAKGAKFCGGKTIEKAWEAAGNGFVVAGLFVGEEESGFGCARGGGGETEFRIEQNGAGVGREDATDVRFEIGEQVSRNFFGGLTRRFSKKLAKSAALLDGVRGDDAAIGSECGETLLFSGRKLHACLRRECGGERRSLLGVIEPGHCAVFEWRQMKDELAL